MQDNFELLLSFAVVLFLAGVYIVYELIAIPAGGHPFGHSLGILGTVLMVLTETVYSARKRLPFFNVGLARHWLSFHIFTGIVGPALVLMHTGLHFRGLAGLTIFLTLLVVASGFLGRYIYTAVPRTLAGVEIGRRALQAELAREQEALAAWSAQMSAQVQALLREEAAIASRPQADLSYLDVLARRWHEWRERQRIHAAIGRLNQAEQVKMAEIEKMLGRQQRLARQLRSLQTVQQLMSLWHTMHVPLGLTLFTATAIHIIATIYYGAIS